MQSIGPQTKLQVFTSSKSKKKLNKLKNRFPDEVMDMRKKLFGAEHPDP